MLSAHGFWWLIFATSFPILLNLLLDVGPVFHLQFQLELLHLGQALVLLPDSILLIEPFASFMLQVMAMRHTVHPVHDLRMRFHQLPAL